MMELIFSGWLTVALPAATSFFCLASVFGILSLVLLNKGAKVNFAWGLIAAGLLADALAEGDRVLAALGLTDLKELRDVARLCGALLIFGGVLYGRDVLKRLVK